MALVEPTMHSQECGLKLSTREMRILKKMQKMIVVFKQT
jgi:hypothetical protein